MAQPALFALNVPAGELVVSGTAIYLLWFVFFRLGLRRELGGFNIADLLALVLIADAAQNAMSGEYTTVAEGAVLLGTILGWNILFRMLAFRFRQSRRNPGMAWRLRGWTVVIRQQFGKGNRS